jgi:hypothetical protein
MDIDNLISSSYFDSLSSWSYFDNLIFWYNLFCFLPADTGMQ